MPQTDVGRRRAIRLGIHALEQGGTRAGLGTVEWNAAGNCLWPVQIVSYGRKDAVDYIAYDSTYNNAAWPCVYLEEPRHPMRFNVDMLVRCRRCQPCLTAKARHWAHRAFEEIRCSPRTWFGTLTLAPEVQQIMLDRARVRLAKQGLDYDQLEEADRFRCRDDEIRPDISRMFKRMRKVHGLRFRYLVVSEAHQSGEPHYHLFLHEIEHGSIKHAMLAAQWRHGFSKWKLVDENNSKAAWYACKYLSKGSSARVRASLHYGREPERAETSTLSEHRKLEISETSEISTCLTFVTNPNHQNRDCDPPNSNFHFSEGEEVMGPVHQGGTK